MRVQASAVSKETSSNHQSSNSTRTTEDLAPKTTKPLVTNELPDRGSNNGHCHKDNKCAKRNSLNPPQSGSGRTSAEMLQFHIWVLYIITVCLGIFFATSVTICFLQIQSIKREINLETAAADYVDLQELLQNIDNEDIAVPYRIDNIRKDFPHGDRRKRQAENDRKEPKSAEAGPEGSGSPKEWMWMGGYARVRRSRDSKIEAITEYCKKAQLYCYADTPSGKGGRIGPPGPPGFPGVSGLKGDRGEDGFAGLPGPKGDKGSAPTVMMAQNLTDMRGMRGPPGPKGDEGQRGPSGPRGPRGPLGPLGRPGETGRPGLDGTQGPRGQKGELGKRGLLGFPGLKGDPGPEGPDGPKGHGGSPGALGHKGQKGGNGYRGAKGDRGTAGTPGIPGMKGFKGDRGSNGLPGLPGMKGFKGDVGHCEVTCLGEKQTTRYGELKNAGRNVFPWAWDASPRTLFIIVCLTINIMLH